MSTRKYPYTDDELIAAVETAVEAAVTDERWKSLRAGNGWVTAIAVAAALIGRFTGDYREDRDAWAAHNQALRELESWLSTHLARLVKEGKLARAGGRNRYLKGGEIETPAPQPTITGELIRSTYRGTPEFTTLERLATYQASREGVESEQEVAKAAWAALVRRAAAVGVEIGRTKAGAVTVEVDDFVSVLERLEAHRDLLEEIGD